MRLSFESRAFDQTRLSLNLLVQILSNLPVSYTAVPKHPALVEQGVAEDGDDPPDRRVILLVASVALVINKIINN